MWLLIILLVIVVGLAVYLISAYNGLIRRRNQKRRPYEFQRTEVTIWLRPGAASPGGAQKRH